MKRSVVIVFCFVSAVALILTACNKRSAGPSASTTGPSGEFSLAISTFNEEILDPTQMSNVGNWNLLYPILDPLIGLESGNLAPRVAERWEPADGPSWIFYIRKGIKFHNGDELTAEDVLFSLQYQIDNNRFVSDLKNDVDHMELVDPYTIRVYTKSISPYLPASLSLYSPGQGWILPKKYIEKNGIEYFRQHPIGSGPYKFVRHSPGDSIEYEADENNWRKVPAFRKLTILLIPEETTRISLLKTGQVDMIEISLDGAAGLQGTEYKTQAINFHTNEIEFFGAYDPRAVGMPVSNIKVRQALSLGINREEIIKTFFGGKAIMPLPLWFTQANAEDIDISYWQEQAKSYYRYDPEEAKRLLREAGYPSAFNNPVINLWTYTMGGAPYLPKLAEIVAGYWGKLGVQVQLVPTEWGKMSTIQNVLQSDGMVGQARMHRAQPRPNTAITLNTYLGGRGRIAMFGDKFPDIDKLIDEASSEPDADKRREIIGKTMKLVMDTYIVSTISQAPSMAAWGPKIDIDWQIPTPSITLNVEQVQHK